MKWRKWTRVQPEMVFFAWIGSFQACKVRHDVVGSRGLQHPFRTTAELPAVPIWTAHLTPFGLLLALGHSVRSGVGSLLKRIGDGLLTCHRLVLGPGQRESCSAEPCPDASERHLPSHPGGSRAQPPRSAAVRGRLRAARTAPQHSTSTAAPPARVPMPQRSRAAPAHTRRKAGRRALQQPQQRAPPGTTSLAQLVRNGAPRSPCYRASRRRRASTMHCSW